MNRASLVLVAALGVAATAVFAAPPGPPPGPPPPYQMRPVTPTGDRLKPGGDGKVLFEVHCGYCHLTGGMGTNLLTKQQVMAGDLTADYVRQVVRMGKNAMPQQTKVDITDAELDAVARYLGKGK